MIQTLTKTQANQLAFMVGYVDRHGYAPSYRTIAEALGLASISGVHRVNVALEERGVLRRHAEQRRAGSYDFVRPAALPKANILLRALMDVLDSGGTLSAEDELVIRIRDAMGPK